jgi:uncharacterized protein YdcH (DUF465 family)
MSQKHDLAEDFPQHRERIHDLKVRDAHFARLFDEYDRVEHEIRRIDMNIQPSTDEHAEELKRRRLGLKDQMARMLDDDAHPHPRPHRH